MKEVKENDSIRMHYTCETDDGLKFSSHNIGQPLEFKVGEGKLLKAIEEGVIGMKKDETKNINIPCGDAYGPVVEELIQEIEKEALPEGLNPEIGMELATQDNEGNEIRVRVAKVMDDSIIIDANHPLAGKDLIFEIELVEVL